MNYQSRCMLMLLVAVFAHAYSGRLQAQNTKKSEQFFSRGLADSTYAVAIAIDEIAEGIRRGVFPYDRRDVSDVQSAAAGLAAAAARRSIPLPRQDLGPAWDFQLRIQKMTFLAPDHANVELVIALDASDLETPHVIVPMRRVGSRWQIAEVTALTERIQALARRLEVGK